MEELDGAYAVYADEPPLGFDVLEAEDVEDGWEDAWRAFHHGVQVGGGIRGLYAADALPRPL